MGVPVIYINRPLTVEFLDKKLCKLDNENIWQKNLFTVLSSLEIIATSRFFSILHDVFVIPFCWRSGNTHTLSKYNWGIRSMCRALDLLHNACGQLWDSIACFKSVKAVTQRLKKLKYQKDEYQALKDKIQIRYRGFGWKYWKARWSSTKRTLTNPELIAHLKELIREENKLKTVVPDKPVSPIHHRSTLVQLGQATKQLQKLDEKANDNIR